MASFPVFSPSMQLYGEYDIVWTFIFFDKLNDSPSDIVQ